MRWFQSKPNPEPAGADPAASLPERLKLLEREADQARLGFRGTPLNRAGDLCMQAKQNDQALSYYGRAIDAYLQDGHPELARGVAQKLIRVHPGAVRTYCTLTWLDLGLGYLADARTHVGGYVAAARRAGREELAIQQIREMSRTVTDQGFRIAAATALEDLGDHSGARELKDAMPEQPMLAPDEVTRERCFQAAKSSGGPTL
jgi:tetratricopeptide (TPR) repeat protein